MEMDQGAKRWMLKYAHANYWRVVSWYEFTDLVQDGHLYWWKIVSKYPDAKDRPHLMRLFQRSFSNHIHNLASGKTDQVDLPIADCLSGDEDTESVFLERHDTGTPDSSHALAHAAPTVRRAINVLLEQADKLRLPTRRADGTRQTTNEKLCAIAGCDPGMIDLVAEIKICLAS